MSTTNGATPTNRPNVILDPHPRTMVEVFDPADLNRLASFADVLWAQDAPLPDDELTALAPRTWAYVAARPRVDRPLLDAAAGLRTVIEVSGGFPPTIDYASCFQRGIRVLGCAPAFGTQVAEMALTMSLAAGRGLVAEHETFRQGTEVWQADRPAFDFSLFGQPVGFVGAGSIARALLPLLAPFGCTVSAYDPWQPETQIRAMGCRPATLDQVLETSRVVFVLAVPTVENRGLIGAEQLARMPDGALLVLISRAHLVDFDALTAELHAGRLQAAIDVFPEEPCPPHHPVRRAPNVILSAHRAASIRKERQAIGKMVVDDLELLARGLPPARLQTAEPELVALYAAANRG